MDKMKKYFIYIIWLILLAIITNFLIEVGLNSTYKPMKIDSSDNVSQVDIYQAESTKVNGRIRGIIKNDAQNPVEAKYIKFDFYTDRDINMGSKYIEIDNTKTEQPFEAFFKLNNVTNYKMSLVNEKDSSQEIEYVATDLSTLQIVMATTLTMLIFWG